MSLKLAAIVPHPPILIPSIGKENILRLEKTKNSYSKIEEYLAAEKIETIVIVSSHGPIRPDTWSINLAPEFEINFEEFGDFSAKLNLGGDLELAQNIREKLIEHHQVQAISQPTLDHGCGVPLYSLLANQKNIEVVPLYIAHAGLLANFNLGKIIGAQIEKGRKKIAVLASGDLSHTLEKKSPAGFSPRAAKFDQRIIELLQNKSVIDFLNLDENLIAEAKPCGLSAIAMLLGILGNTGYDIASTAYESPFGVGYLSMIFKPLPN
ncbi:MAG: AmmeMemoRadiSam system protein B [Patescibacteria group bacterium]|nr:AmmeMemoRadiSam system protein B [Patescibacteria group bacterium]